jgi:aerobic carbon-monoxide dehydrogenase medium subunit
MIPAAFDYEAPESLEEAIRMLHENGEDAKLLAGGHSLLPLMKLRLAAPTVLIDLKNIPGLHGIQRDNGSWRIGPMTRHADLQDTPELGLASRAASLIADQQVRNRGTIGGSLAHGDPAADLPAVLVVSDGEVAVRGTGGDREIAAADLFQDYLTTSLAQDEVITSIRLPALDGYGVGYEKFIRRAEDWTMVGVAAVVKKAEDGSCADVRVGLTHMGTTPVRATTTEDALRGGPLDAGAIAAAAEHAAEGTEPPGDLNATPEYKRHLARVLTRRALEEAAGL